MFTELVLEADVDGDGEADGGGDFKQFRKALDHGQFRQPVPPTTHQITLPRYAMPPKHHRNTTPPQLTSLNLPPAPFSDGFAAWIHVD